MLGRNCFTESGKAQNAIYYREPTVQLYSELIKKMISLILEQTQPQFQSLSSNYTCNEAYFMLIQLTCCYTVSSLVLTIMNRAKQLVFGRILKVLWCQTQHSTSLYKLVSLCTWASFSSVKSFLTLQVLCITHIGNTFFSFFLNFIHILVTLLHETSNKTLTSKQFAARISSKSVSQSTFKNSCSQTGILSVPFFCCSYYSQEGSHPCGGVPMKS